MNHPPLQTTVTFLQMHAKPERHVMAPVGVSLMVLRAEQPSLGFYRYLYETVGKPWVWVNRRRMNDSELAATIHQPGIEVYVLYARGEPAGYAELDARNPDNIELAYFGLMPEFVGLGVGAFFLGEAISLAWDKRPRRIHVQTCTLDHPRALPLYQRMGFQPFSQTEAFVTPIGDEPHPLVLAQKAARSMAAQ